MKLGVHASDVFVRNQASKLGAVICEARKQQGLTQAELAKRLHVTIPTVRKLESGNASVSLHTCLAALFALNIKQVMSYPVCDAEQALPQIKPKQKLSFTRKLELQGIHANDAENAAWILSLSPQQRMHVLINQDKEQALCGIARR